MLILKVPDMSCGHCVKTITLAVHTVAPEALVHCDVASKVVKLGGEFDSAQIENSIKQAGYHPEILES
jgi:copper chaperone